MSKERITMDMQCLIDLVGNAILFGHNDIGISGHSVSHYDEISKDFIAEQLEAGNIPGFKEPPTT